MSTTEVNNIAPNSENVIELTDAGIIGLDTLCRLCANRTDHLIPIYEGEGAEHELEMKMNRYLPFRVEKSQSMPMHCCFQCATTVLQWHELIEVSLEANRRLRALQEDAIVHLTKQYPKPENELIEIVSDNVLKNNSPQKSHETEMNGTYSLCQDNFYTVTTLDESLFKQEIDDESDSTERYTEEGIIYYDDKRLFYISEQTGEPIKTEENVDVLFQPVMISDASEPYTTKKIDDPDDKDFMSMDRFIMKRCFICESVFKSNRTLTKHFLMAHGTVRVLEKKSLDEFSTTCDICLNNFDEKDQLIEHYKNEHDITITFADTSQRECGSVFVPTDAQSLDIMQNEDPSVVVFTDAEWENAENLQKKFVCDICGNGFTRKYDLKRHCKTIHTENIDEPSVKQTSSEEEDTGQKTGRPRRRRVKLKETRRYYCDHCTKSFTRPNDVRRHLYKIHGVGPPGGKTDGVADTPEKREILERSKVEIDGRTFYKCEICNKVHRLPYLFLLHWRVHTGEKPYCCHICAKTFRDSSGLNTHIKVFHYQIKNHQCHECGRKFSSKAVRDKHAELHLDVRPFICDVCGKAFKQKVSLYVHKKFHSDQKPFACLVCGKQFRRNFELTTHGWLHTGYKPHECPECGNRFRLKQDLNRHVKVHNKPAGDFRCEICGSVFNQMRYLRNHMRKHKMNVVDCKMELEEKHDISLVFND